VVLACTTSADPDNGGLAKAYKDYGITRAAIGWTIRALIDLALLHARAMRIKKEYAFV